MKTFSLSVVAVALLFQSTLIAGDVEWQTDFEKAKILAAEKEVPIFANFSGSDWCGWCIRLNKEVLSQDAFKDYAKENLVLFVADYPRRLVQDKTVKTQNQKLLNTYEVQGFPTILLLDAEGEMIGRTGYQHGGPEAYVEHVKEIIKGDQK